MKEKFKKIKNVIIENKKKVKIGLIILVVLAVAFLIWFFFLKPKKIDYDFEALFLEAEEYCAGFFGARNIEIDSSKKLEDGYYLVLDKDFGDLDKLEDKLNTMFTKNLTKQLLNLEVEEGKPIYKEADGKVYYLTGYGAGIYYTMRENDFSLEVVNSEKVILHDTITYPDLDDSNKKATFDYIIVKDNGKWVFQTFELPINLYFYAS